MFWNKKKKAEETRIYTRAMKRRRGAKTHAKIRGKKEKDQDPSQVYKKGIQISQLEALDVYLHIMDLHIATWNVLVA